MRYLLSCLLVITLVGCAAKPRHYNDGVGKRPLYLSLYTDGTYFLRHEGTAPYPNPDERGIWFDLTNDSIVESLSHELIALMPHDEARPVRYAKVNVEPSPLGNLKLFDNLKSSYLDSLDVSNIQIEKRFVDKGGCRSAQDSADNSPRSKEELQQRLKELLALRDPGPLSREEYSSLTQQPYPRKPFLESDVASQAYFAGFRNGFAKSKREPGQLYVRIKLSGSIIDAAKDAGFSAGMMGDLSQLTDAERKEILAWETIYEEVSMWPYMQNAELELDFKIKTALEELDAIEKTE
ncbi:MAG: hypothetical protein AAGI37_17705 [Planctomycetota bacterium]